MKTMNKIFLSILWSTLMFSSFGQEVVIWQETFSGGIPTNWLNEEANGAAWEYRGPNTLPDLTVGSRGSCTNNFSGDPLHSSSQNDGFVLFDSNYWDNDSLPCTANNIGSGPVPGPHLAYLTTPSIDLSASSYAALEWEQFIRFYQGTTRVEVSVNQGVWSLLHANDVPVASSSENPQKKRVYLSNNILGNSDVRFRFVYEGLYYFWMLDDIKILEISANDLKINSTTYGDFDFVDPAHPTGYEWMEYSIYPTAMAPTLKFSAQIENWGGLAQTGCGLNAQLFSDVNNSLLYNGTTTDLITIPVGGSAEVRAGQFTMSADTGNYSILYRTLQNEVDEVIYNHLDTAHFRISPCVLARDRGIVNRIYEGSTVFWNSTFELGNIFLPTYDMPVSAISVALGDNADVNATLKGKIHTFQYGDSLVEALIAETPLQNVNLNALNAPGEQAKFQYLTLSDTVVLQANTPYWITVESSAGTNHLPIAMSHEAELYTSWIKNSDGYFYLTQIPLIRIQSCMDTGQANPDTTTSVTYVDWSKWVLYPNPTEDVLFVNGIQAAHGLKYSVIDVTGRKIMEGTYNTSHGIQVSSLPSGFYQLMMVSEKKKNMLSFIKK
jgi:hypothetical protein